MQRILTLYIRFFFAKERPIDHPLIVHLGDMNQLNDWAVDISEAALLLAKAFWPGPLTLILKKSPSVSDLVTGGQDTIGLRIPNHPLALKLLGAVGTGLAAPSANRFGRISPTTAEAVREELGNKVDIILDGGPCSVGLESTIIDMRAETPVMLRPGMIDRAAIERILKRSIAVHKKKSIRVSGNLDSHYAPQTPMRLVEPQNIQQCIFNMDVKTSTIAVLSRQDLPPLSNVCLVRMSEDPTSYAHDLYRTLRALDKQHFQEIIVESVPEDDSWSAVRDRLQRAATR